VKLTWGEVLGASGYRVRRRRRGETGYQEIFAGPAFAYVDREAHGVRAALDDPDRDAVDEPGGSGGPGGPAAATIYEYAVAACDGNGVGAPSAPVPTDPRGWRHWRPPIPLTFRRHHSYHQPPYLPGPLTAEHYDGQEPPPDLPAIAELL
jgi:hypothetical protein